MRYDTDDCLNFDDHCLGPVEPFAVPGGNAFPRCAFHRDRRMSSYESSDLERYASSDVPLRWFDPSFAGEHWDEDY